jgi:hypothetical protein
MAIENTVRLDILLTLEELFKGLTEATDGVKFSTVTLGPLGPTDATKRLSLGIVPGKEKKDRLSRAADCTLPLDIEFRITINQGDVKPQVLGEQVLGIVQQAINRDPSLGDLVIDMTEVGNEVSLDTYQDRTVMGVVNYEVRYRHAERDVRDPNLSA